MTTGFNQEMKNSGASFMPDPSVSTVGRRVADMVSDIGNTAFSAPKTALTTVTGIDFTQQNSLKVNVDQACASGANASANLNAQANTKGAMDQLDQQEGACKQVFADTARTMSAALEMGAGDLGIDPGSAAKSFAPAPTRGATDGIAAMIDGKVAGFTAMAEIYSEVKGPKKLSAEAESKLAAQAIKCLTPERDANGNVFEARIENNLDQAAMEKLQQNEALQVVREIMNGYENSPEAQAFNDMRHDLEAAQDRHIEMQNTNHATVATAEQYGVDHADVDVQSSGALNENRIQKALSEQAEWGVDNALVNTRNLNLPVENASAHDVGVTKEGLAALNDAYQNTRTPPEPRNDIPPPAQVFSPSMLSS